MVLPDDLGERARPIFPVERQRHRFASFRRCLWVSSGVFGLCPCFQGPISLSRGTDIGHRSVVAPARRTTGHKTDEPGYPIPEPPRAIVTLRGFRWVLRLGPNNFPARSRPTLGK